jgi:hypothetical protein
MKITSILAVVLAAAFALPAVAQTQTPAIDQTERNQSQRIDQGVRSGALTAQEGNQLQRQQARIRADKNAMKSKGYMTREERQNIRMRQERANQHIYRQKHQARDGYMDRNGYRTNGY